MTEMKYQAILCEDSRMARYKNRHTFNLLKGMKPRVERCLQSYNDGTVTEGQLKQTLLAFADAQQEYTKAFRDMINFMADDEQGVELIELAVPEYSADPPPPYSRYPDDSQLQVLGVRRREVSNRSPPAVGQPEQGSATGSSSGDDGGDDNHRRPGQGHRGSGQGMCPSCAQATFEEESGSFLDLVESFFRKFLEVMCNIDRKLRDLALWVLEAITSLFNHTASHRAQQAQTLNTWAIQTSSRCGQWSSTPLLA